MSKGRLREVARVAELSFRHARIAAIATTCGNERIRFADEREKYGLEEKEVARLKKAVAPVICLKQLRAMV